MDRVLGEIFLEKVTVIFGSPLGPLDICGGNTKKC